jgi:hypothetical protein
LARPDTEIEIFVSQGTKLDITWSVRGSEPMFSRLIKASGHLRDLLRVSEFRAPKFDWEKVEELRSSGNTPRVHLPFKKSAARRLTNTDP